MSRTLLVQLTQMRLYEIIDLETAFETLHSVDENILTAVSIVIFHFCHTIEEKSVKVKKSGYISGLKKE